MPRIEPVPKFFPSTEFEHETKKSSITMLRIEPTKITMLRIEHETFSITMPRIEPVQRNSPLTPVFEHETKKSSITMLRIEPTTPKSPCQESNLSKEIFPAQNRTPN